MASLMKKTSSRSTRSSSHKEVSVGPHPWCPMWGCLLSHCLPPPDSSTYATFLFNAFDTDHDGSVSFEVSQGGGQALPGALCLCAVGWDCHGQLLKDFVSGKNSTKQQQKEFCSFWLREKTRGISVGLSFQRVTTCFAGLCVWAVHHPARYH